MWWKFEIEASLAVKPLCLAVICYYQGVHLEHLTWNFEKSKFIRGPPYHIHVIETSIVCHNPTSHERPWPHRWFWVSLDVISTASQTTVAAMLKFAFRPPSAPPPPPPSLCRVSCAAKSPEDATNRTVSRQGEQCGNVSAVLRQRRRCVRRRTRVNERQRCYIGPSTSVTAADHVICVISSDDDDDGGEFKSNYLFSIMHPIRFDTTHSIIWENLKFLWQNRPISHILLWRQNLSSPIKWNLEYLEHFINGSENWNAWSNRVVLYVYVIYFSCKKWNIQLTKCKIIV